jgi:hypothetical protein
MGLYAAKDGRGQAIGTKKPITIKQIVKMLKKIFIPLLLSEARK